MKADGSADHFLIKAAKRPGEYEVPLASRLKGWLAKPDHAEASSLPCCSLAIFEVPAVGVPVASVVLDDNRLWR